MTIGGGMAEGAHRERWPTLSLEVAVELGRYSGLAQWRDMEAVRGPGRRKRKAERGKKRRCRQCNASFIVPARRGPIPLYCSPACCKRWHGTRKYRAVKHDAEQYQVHLLAARVWQETRRREQGAVPWSQRKLPVAPSYGAWTVLRELTQRRGQRMVLCRCACGNEKPVQFAHLRSGRSSRCARCSARAKRSRPMAFASAAPAGRVA